jgi:hypothetical protein
MAGRSTYRIGIPSMTPKIPDLRVTKTSVFPSGRFLSKSSFAHSAAARPSSYASRNIPPLVSPKPVTFPRKSALAKKAPESLSPTPK